MMIETVPTRALTHSLTAVSTVSLQAALFHASLPSTFDFQFHRFPLRPDQQPHFLLPSISYWETSFLKHRNGKPQEST